MAVADVLNSWFVVEADIDLKVKINEDNLLEVNSRTNKTTDLSPISLQNIILVLLWFH